MDLKVFGIKIVFKVIARDGIIKDSKDETRPKFGAVAFPWDKVN